MSDMTAFERQLSGEITGLMGPENPVDDAAIFTAITTTQSPKWRFQSMFNATKFVVGAAIVALFGGFLLSGVHSETATIPGAPSHNTFVVDQDGSGDHTTISEAVEAALDGDTILIKPGTYIEAILVEKDIALMGEGDRETIVIEAPEDGPTSFTGFFNRRSSDAPYAVLLKDTAATLSGLSFRGERAQVHANGGGPMMEDLFFDRVGRTYEGDAYVGGGVTMTGGTTATFRGNTLTEGGAITIYDGSEPLIEDNTLTGGPYIVGHLGDGAVIRGNVISGANVWGMLIVDPTTALIEGNTITDVPTGIRVGWPNHGTGVDPVIRANTISGSNGIRIMKEANPTIIENTLTGHRITIAIAGSDARIADNELRDNGRGIVINAGSPALDGNSIRGGTTGIEISGSDATPILNGNIVCDNEKNLVLSEDTEVPDTTGNDICPDDPAKSSE